mgnify:FL=1
MESIRKQNCILAIVMFALMSILISFPVQAQTINQKQAKATVQYASIPSKVETASYGDIYITVKNISDDYRVDYDMRILDSKGKVVEVSEQNGGIEHFSYLKKNRLYYYQIRETRTAVYPWEEDSIGGWTKKVPFVIAQYQLSQVGTGRKVRIKMPKISGVKSYKVYMSYKKDRAWKKLKTVKAGKSIVISKFKGKALARNKKYYYKIVPSKGVNATIGVIRFSKKK